LLPVTRVDRDRQLIDDLFDDDKGKVHTGKFVPTVVKHRVNLNEAEDGVNADNGSKKEFKNDLCPVFLFPVSLSKKTFIRPFECCRFDGAAASYN
jgi:hypothetical protein